MRMSDAVEEIWRAIEALSDEDRKTLLLRARDNYGVAKMRSNKQRDDAADKVFRVVNDLGYINRAIAVKLGIIEPKCRQSSWAYIVKKAQAKHNTSFDVRKGRGNSKVYLRPAYEGEVPAFTSLSKYAFKHLWSVHVNGDTVVNVIGLMRSNISDFPCVKTFKASKPVIMHMTVVCDTFAGHFGYRRVSQEGEVPVYEKVSE